MNRRRSVKALRFAPPALGSLDLRPMPASRAKAMISGADRPEQTSDTTIGMRLATFLGYRIGAGMIVFTIGHSTHPIDTLLQLLAQQQITHLVDVRRFPGSRRLPQFGQPLLPQTLAAHGIGYDHLPTLGGRRRATPVSPNTGWQHPAFRGYADYMASDAFAAGPAHVLHLDGMGRVVLLCAEALWWRCHRRLIADALVVRGHRVVHILGSQSTTEHQLTSFAQAHGFQITYPALTDGASGG